MELKGVPLEQDAASLGLDVCLDFVRLPNVKHAKPTKCSPHYHQRNFVMGDTVVLKYTGKKKRTSVIFILILKPFPYNL